MTTRCSMLVSLVCLVGCEQQEKWEKVDPIPQFSVGEVVVHKVDERKGVIVRRRVNYRPFPYVPGPGTNIYDVRFAVDAENVSAIDTAAGSGFGGHTNHYPPSMYVIVGCVYEELRKSY